MRFIQIDVEEVLKKQYCRYCRYSATEFLRGNEEYVDCAVSPGPTVRVKLSRQPCRYFRPDDNKMREKGDCGRCALQQCPEDRCKGFRKIVDPPDDEVLP